MKNKSLYNQLLSIISVVVSIGSVLSLYFTFNLKDNGGKLSETFVAIAIGISASILAAYFAKIFTQKKSEKIFILYSHKDKEFVDKLKSDLRRFRYIALIDSDVLKVGDKINEVIANAISKSDIILFVISNNSNKSDYVQKEYKKVLESEKMVLPLKIDKESEIPSDLKGILYSDFTSDYSKSLRDLIKGIEKTGKITTPPNTLYK